GREENGLTILDDEVEWLVKLEEASLQEGLALSREEARCSSFVIASPEAAIKL
ncbi:hypothetical protein ACLOJK_034884, partial [Asimina triloba]